MHANPNKLQAIAVGKRTLGNSEIKCEEMVKLPVVDIDYQLSFDQHINSLCRKADQQLNVLKSLNLFFLSK